MSAIAGLFHKKNEPIGQDNISRIMEPLHKFPSNDIQVWKKENVFLGCHAQWITPESINEQLPFYDYEREMVITADAIIDNREELFNKLEVDLHKRKGMPDSLLILLAYQKWGEESPRYLVGDFAFMIWDERKQKLFGARDFSGGRTLYYINSYSAFAFCTIIKPLLNLPNVSKDLNQDWVAEFLVIAGMVDVADTSITPYKDIEQLPPAHSITIMGEKLRIKRYCVLTPEKQIHFKTDGEYVEGFQKVFQEAVTSRTRTYRNVGAQLSGGLDSGSIVSFAAQGLRQEKKQLHTFSYVPTQDFVDFTASHVIADERPFIKSTVNYVGGITDHYLDFQGRDSYSEINSIMETMEMPYKFYVNSFWLKGIFEEANSLDIGVLLNGGRGNLSISWGDALPYYSLLLKRFKWIQMMSEVRQFSLNIGSGRKNVLSSVLKLASPSIVNIRTSNSSEEMPLINADFAKKTKVLERIREYGFDKSGRSISKDPYENRKQHFEQLFHWNASNTLAAKLSLQYSLWKRDPTNDIRVIKYCLSLPEHQFVQNGLNRALIRRATENLLPNNVRLNMKIRGVQGADWIHRMIPKWDEFSNEVENMSYDSTFMEIVNYKKVNEALSKLKEGVRPEDAYSGHIKVLMDSLIVYRFIKNNY